MRKVILGTVILVASILFLLEVKPVKVHADGENLILNPGVESGDAQPTNWNFGFWGGTVATTSYSTTDGSSGKALGVAVTDAGSGDAKWYHDQVPVTAGKTYTFNDSYKSSVNTDIIVRYTYGIESYQYDLVATAPASTSWTTVSADITVPNNVTHLTIFHVISSVGELWTDNFSLVEKVVVPPVEPPTEEPPVEESPAPATEYVLNPSFETSNGSAPANWQSNAWGTNSATFEYATSGNTGSRSGYVKITSYTDGDAKWYHDAIEVTPGQVYTFKDFYKSNINSEVVVQYRVGVDTYQYEYLGGLAASANWSQSQFNFTAPSNATHATLFHLIAGVGELWTDDYSITKATIVVPQQPGHNENQILNPSVEIANGNTPANWQSNAWGNNSAVFEYANVGQNGSKSLYVKVQNYVDGDAKWFHSPINVTDDSSIDFSNYYKSTAPSETVIQFEMADGSYVYKWLGTNPASSDWVKSQYHFVAPVGVKRLTVFHVMAQNGELWSDNFELLFVLPTPADSQVPNGNLEIEDSVTSPQSWSQNSWGNNDAQFEYLHNFGYNSDHSVKVTINNYVDGDAKWFHNGVELKAGVNYKVTDYYQSNVDSRIVLAVTMLDGTTQYIELPTAPASANWTQYSGTFTMPSGAMSVSIYHLLASVGFLITDNFNITEYAPVPFNRGLITLTFDDGWEDNITTALPLMQQYGYKSNQFYATTFIKNSEWGEAEAIDAVRSFELAGHEIGSHTITHPDLTTLSTADVQKELAESKAYLESIFDGPINYFATPYGAYNQAVKAQIMSNYTLHRTVDVGYNSKDNFDITRLKVQNILSTTRIEEVQGWIDQAMKEKTWLILVLHRVANDPGPYDTNPQMFESMLSTIQSSGIKVATISEALAELNPQM